MAETWKKSEPALVERFARVMPDHPDVENKKMFGYPAAFVRGNFFTGLHQDAFVLRLPGGLKDSFPALSGAEPFDPMQTGKGMKDWWVIPASIVEDETRLADLLAQTFAEVVKLPPKPKKEPRRKSAK